jgi:hypothetical protein
MFEKIREVVPSVRYLCGNGEIVPPPVDADTANMKFVEAGGYVVGFASLTDEERGAVESLLNVSTLEERLQAAELIISMLAEA